MTQSGIIKSYDKAAGAGTIASDKNGAVLAFGKVDLQEQGQEPRVDQRYDYETHEVDGRQKRAINLQQQQQGAVPDEKQQEQARNQQG